MMSEKDVPLEAMETQGTYFHNVVDLSSVRIQSGRLPIKARKCEHRQLIYSQSERRVWCEQCERTIDSFDAFMVLTNDFQKMTAEIFSKQHKVDEALKANVVRRAAKALDKAWHSHAVGCPHCRKGLLPEDFADGARTAFGRDYEIARRKRERVATPNTEQGAET